MTACILGLTLLYLHCPRRHDADEPIAEKCVGEVRRPSLLGCTPGNFSLRRKCRERWPGQQSPLLLNLQLSAVADQERLLFRHSHRALSKAPLMSASRCR